MSETRYQMNPAEDMILFANDLREGMLVLGEQDFARPQGAHAEQFQRIIRVRRTHWQSTYQGDSLLISFIGEFADGHQEGTGVGAQATFIVRKNSVPGLNSGVMTFGVFEQATRDRVAQVRKEEGFTLGEALFRVEEEVSAIAGTMLDEYV